MFHRGLKECMRNMARLRVDGKKVVKDEVLHRICPGFNIGTCGPRPMDQDRLVEKELDKERVKQTAADFKAEIKEMGAYSKKFGKVVV